MLLPQVRQGTEQVYWVRMRREAETWRTGAQPSQAQQPCGLQFRHTIELVMPSNHLIFCHPLLLLPSIFSSIRVFSTGSVLRIRWPVYWSFSFSPSNEYSELISFRIDWLDLLAVQATLKSLLQHHSSKASILQHSAFFIVKLSHPYMTTGKTIALTTWTFIGKVMKIIELDKKFITEKPEQSLNQLNTFYS